MDGLSANTSGWAADRISGLNQAVIRLVDSLPWPAVVGMVPRAMFGDSFDAWNVRKVFISPSWRLSLAAQEPGNFQCGRR